MSVVLFGVETGKRARDDGGPKTLLDAVYRPRQEDCCEDVQEKVRAMAYKDRPPAPEKRPKLTRSDAFSKRDPEIDSLVLTRRQTPPDLG